MKAKALPMVVLLLSLWSQATLADPLVGYEVKWSQLPDMNQGTDWTSMHRTGGPVVTDDFRSNGKTIYGFRWWGSYFQNDPNLAPGASRQVGFEISFHPDCLAGQDCGNGGPYSYSTPGLPYQSQIVSAQESFFGSTTLGEKVYEYWALLNAPWNETAGNIYWADIAWVAGQFQTDPAADVWGWHESSDHWNDDAVQTVPGQGGNPHMGPWNRLAGRDMAFQVLTVPEPATLALATLGLVGIGMRRRGSVSRIF